MTRARDLLAGAFAALLLFGTTADAADIKVYATIGMGSVLKELQPKFEQASGHKLDITWGLAGALAKRVADGETPDALVAIRGGVDGLVTSGRIAAPSAATLALSGVGVSVRSGAPKPDISSPEKLKEALIAAKAIAYSDPSKGGASGVHFAKVAERLGIADLVKAKSKHPETAGLPGKRRPDGWRIWRSRRCRNCWRFREPICSGRCRATCRTSRRLQAEWSAARSSPTPPRHSSSSCRCPKPSQPSRQRGWSPLRLRRKLREAFCDYTTIITGFSI